VEYVKIAENEHETARDGKHGQEVDLFHDVISLIHLVKLSQKVALLDI
jgi:hypothetical protein